MSIFQQTSYLSQLFNYPHVSIAHENIPYQWVFRFRREVKSVVTIVTGEPHKYLALVRQVAGRFIKQ